MDNMYQPPSGGPQDNWPTQQFGSAGDRQPQPGTQRPSRGSRKLRWSAGIALAAVLAGGGALAATTLTGTPAANASQNSGQAASLNTILSSASTPISGTGAAAGSPESAGTSAAGQGAAAGSAAAGSSASGNADAAALSQNVAPAAHPAATACKRAIATLRSAGRRHIARVVRRACRRGAVRRLVALRGLHGQFTVKTTSGTKTIGFARGVIQSVTGSAVNIKAADNTTWTWDLVSTTVIRQNGKKVSASSLSAGEQVFAGGQVVSGSNDARLIVIRPAKPASGSSAANGSASSSAS